METTIRTQKFILKLFPEIMVKGSSAKRQMVGQLYNNLQTLLKRYSSDIQIKKFSDKLEVVTPVVYLPEVRQTLLDTPGIEQVLEALQFDDMETLDQIKVKVNETMAKEIIGKTFVIRAKRSGTHPFKSLQIEQTVGGYMLAHNDTKGVDLHNPEVTIRLELINKQLNIITIKHQGLGGFPIGTQGDILSLMSGGFDSTIASYLTMKRGMRTHFLFFNLGGRDHEIGVKEVALYLWQKYGCNQRVLFISVPFEEVVAELLGNIKDSHMGVILKRMMLRVGDRLAEELEIDALVTGECVAQVSSQTLRNLSVIDRVTDRLVLRPLIATDKEDIVRMAAEIGTQEFAANMPEYCGVISVNPTTRAKLDRVEAEEARFDMSILDRAIAGARRTRIDQLAEEELERIDVEVLAIPLAGSTVIDIRHPDEQELAPLELHQPVLHIPFYELHRRAADLAPGRTYMLYCGKGVMSRLHASHLVESTDLDVKVYAP